MLGGGIPAGYSVLVAGPSGSGKSVLATNFIMEGARHDEPGIIAVFAGAGMPTIALANSSHLNTAGYQFAREFSRTEGAARELAVVWDLAAAINVGWWRAHGARTWAAAGDPGADDGLCAVCHGSFPVRRGPTSSR